MDDTPTGKIMTVAGPIDPDDLGTTIMHEHLFIALAKQVAPDERSPASDVALWGEKLTLENLHLARSRRSIFDNWILSDEDLAIREAMEFRKMGGDSIVEMTSTGIHRDPEGLLRVSRATGLNIVMGSGWYQKAYHPAGHGRADGRGHGGGDRQGHQLRRPGHRHQVRSHRRGGSAGRADRAQRGEEHPCVGPRQPRDGRGDLLPPRRAGQREVPDAGDHGRGGRRPLPRHLRPQRQLGGRHPAAAGAARIGRLRAVRPDGPRRACRSISVRPTGESA